MTDKQVSRYGNPDAKIALIQMVDDHDLEGMHHEVEEIRRLTSLDFCLIATKVNNWNHDLSPWKAPAVFGNEDFGDGDGKTLEEVMKYCGDPEKTYYMQPVMGRAGYAIRTVERNREGTLETTTYRDRDGNPVMTRQGHARVQREMDAQGNPVWKPALTGTETRS